MILEQQYIDGIRTLRARDNYSDDSIQSNFKSLREFLLSNDFLVLSQSRFHFFFNVVSTFEDTFWTTIFVPTSYGGSNRGGVLEILAISPILLVAWRAHSFVSDTSQYLPP